MQSSRLRRRMSLVSIVRLFSGRPKAPSSLDERRERLATAAELNQLRPVR